MTRTIRIDDDVYADLKKLVIDPFEDTPNIVIRRLLDEKLKKKPVPRSSQKVKRGSLTPQSVYQDWLLYTLWKHFDGRAEKNEVTKRIILLMEQKSLLSEQDFEHVSTGESRAENTIAWGRNKLKEENCIRNDSPRGIWELTDHGRTKAQSLEDTLLSTETY